MSAESRLRLLLAAVGFVAGVAYWLLLDEGALQGAPVVLQRLLSYFAIAAFPAFGLMAGPLSSRRAGLIAVVLGGVSGVLATLAGTRFATDPARLGDMLEPSGDGLIIIPFVMLAALAIPVLTAAGQARGGWRDFQRVLPLAWAAAVKTIVTLLFLGLFWGVYFLSNALLELVGIELLIKIAENDPGAYVISGVVAGVALAVTCELDSIVQTVVRLFLRLLRLLLTPVATVMTLFVVATLVQGLDVVFAANSAAATMMAMAAGAVLLIAAALHFHDDNSALHPANAWACRAMGVVLPVVAAIAAYAIWVRVADYGWTPPRVLAALCAAIVVLFTLPIAAHALAARDGWPARTLRGFAWALLASLTLGALWFTPVIDAQRISASSQYARLATGQVDLSDYSFWPLARDWGVAGSRTLDRLEAETTSPELARRIANARTADNQWEVERIDQDRALAQAWNEEMTRIPRIGDTATPFPTAEDFEDGVLSRTGLRPFLLSCGSTYDQCRAVAGDVLPAMKGTEWLFIAQHAENGRLLTLLFRRSGRQWTVSESNFIGIAAPDTDVIAGLDAGTYEWISPQIRGLQIGPVRILPKEER